MIFTFPNGEVRPDHIRTIFHQPHTHAMACKNDLRQSAAIICDAQTEHILPQPETQGDAARTRVLQRICHCFLGDAVQMQRHSIVRDGNHALAAQPAGDAAAGARRQFVQCGHQAFGIHDHRVQPFGDVACFLHGLMQQIRQSCCFSGRSREILCFQGFGQ